MTIYYNQDPSAKVDYTEDWSTELAANNNATITSHTVIPPTGAVIVQHSATSTAVTFRLDVSAVTPVPSWISVPIHVVLSTGEEDQRSIRVHVAAR